MIMKTIYLTEKQDKFFKENPQLNMSATIRQQIDEYISKIYKQQKDSSVK